MEMDPGEIGLDGVTVEDMSDDQLLSRGSPDTNETFGDPQVLPRVGDQYQVEIPPLMTESEHLQLTKSPTDIEVTDNQSFMVGLPIPIMWVHEQVAKIKHEQMEIFDDRDVRLNNVMEESERSKEVHINLNIEDPKIKIEFLDSASVKRKGSGESENGEQAVLMDMDLPLHQQEEPRQVLQCSNKGYSPLPGSLGSSWSNMEVKSFLLGLYIFGKNLVLVKNFVETREMGDILCYYYGKFYRSDDHRRWSECRKMRSRKCIHGQRIFTGGRQQEFLSRLQSQVSKECQNTLLEVSKTFAEGKILLEDYVFTLKATVGMNALIEAVGIGKGKQDLTGIIDSIKTTRPQIPVGKDCNSLSSGDIIKFLTGDFRLSKNRAHDLFFDAVWPRLIERGWDSVGSKNRGYAGSKEPVVFLIPGIKKFSKRKLVKGTHYFDSVSDVLNKVASDPGLIDLDEDTLKNGGNKVENGSDTEQKFQQDGPSDGRRQRYLQPPVPISEPDILKFTVVDTSLLHAEGSSKVRELRTLPVEVTIVSPPVSHSRETDTDSSEEPESADMFSNGHDDSNTCRIAEDNSEKGVCTEISDCLESDSKQGISKLDTANVAMEDQENHYATCNDKHPSKTMKHQFSRRVKPSQSKYLTPITKRRRLTACGHVETSRRVDICSVDSPLRDQDPCLDLASTSECKFNLPQEKVSTGFSLKGCASDCSEGILRENGVVTALSHEKVERRPLIDLNLPHDLQDFEIGEPVTTEVADSQDAPITESSFAIETEKLEDLQTLETANDAVNAEQQNVGRRQSTRNRPLTTKALEALACGYMNIKRKPKGEKSKLRDNSISRTSQRARGRGGAKGKFTVSANGIVESKADEGVDDEFSSNTHVVSSSQFWSERNCGNELLGSTSPASHPDHSSSRDN